MTDEKREQEPRWRELLEELGPDVVRQRFTARMAVWEPELYRMNPSNDAFIIAWLAEKHATARWRDTRRFLIVAVIAFLTLIPAWIAAYPVLCPWLPVTWTLLRRFCSA